MYNDPSMIINILEERLGLKYESIIKIINDANVNIKERDVKRFLDNKYMESHPDARSRLEKLNAKLSNRRKGSIDEFSERFSLYLDFDKYKFEPYTLKYFVNYITILKNKCNDIIKIIDGLVDGTIPKFILEDLDINLNYDNCILLSDINRLIEPLIYNYELLLDYVKRANNFNTYLDYKISLDTVYKNGLSEVELYPSEELQNSLYEFNGEDGYIPYTEKQKKLIRKRENEMITSMCDIVKNLK